MELCKGNPPKKIVKELVAGLRDIVLLVGYTTLSEGTVLTIKRGEDGPIISYGRMFGEFESFLSIEWYKKKKSVNTQSNSLYLSDIKASKVIHWEVTGVSYEDIMDQIPGLEKDLLSGDT